ncbi:hypothetical protein [Sphingomonas sp. LT1P40]
MKTPSTIAPPVAVRQRWVRPALRVLNASHAQIGTRPENEDGAFSTS